jgi:predicted RNA-binding protein with PUA-like domain
MANHWLFKSEPDVYGIDRLEREGRTEWSGVRNFQARNFMRDMKLGDLGFFYHSSTKPPGIAGVLEVVREAYPDFTQFERGHEYEDPTSRPEKPKWWMVDVAFVRKFAELIPLDTLRAQHALAEMVLLRRGQRLSVQPVSAAQWTTIIRMADAQIEPADGPLGAQASPSAAATNPLHRIIKA